MVTNLQEVHSIFTTAFIRIVFKNQKNVNFINNDHSQNATQSGSPIGITEICVQKNAFSFHRISASDYLDGPSPFLFDYLCRAK
ncbi:MAG: hypothetical protein PHH37_10895 [Paludibacter sp.]|nr:hypothetical protein [Paludibacter sp.]